METEYQSPENQMNRKFFNGYKISSIVAAAYAGLFIILSCVMYYNPAYYITQIIYKSDIDVAKLDQIVKMSFSNHDVNTLKILGVLSMVMIIVIAVLLLFSMVKAVNPVKKPALKAVSAAFILAIAVPVVFILMFELFNSRMQSFGDCIEGAIIIQSMTEATEVTRFNICSIYFLGAVLGVIINIVNVYMTSKAKRKWLETGVSC